MLVSANTPYPPDLRSLTSLRFFAAMAVVLFHFTTLLPFDAGAFAPLFDKGYLAVDFFFILSGFILSHVYLPQVEAARFSAWDFCCKRLARIYPLHMAVFVLYLAAIFGNFFLGSVPIPEYVSLRSIVAQIFLVHAWGIESNLSFNAPSWSISAEWFAYLLFPLLAVKFGKRSETSLILASALFFFALWCLTALLWTRPATSLTFDLGILRILPEFILGMAVYRLGRCTSVKNHGIIWLPACLAAMVAAIYLKAPDCLTTMTFPWLILLAAEHDRRRGDGLLMKPVFIYLGEISYSIYMIHYPLLELAFVFGLGSLYGGAASPALFHAVLWAALAALVPLAALSYHLVEKPGRRRLYRLLKGIKIKRV